MDSKNEKRMRRWFKRSRIYYLFQCSELRERTYLEFKEIVSSSDLSRKSLLFHQVYSIYPTIAAYRVMLESGFEVEEALKLIEQRVIQSATGARTLFRTLSHLPHFTWIFGKMCTTGLKRNYRDGFDMRWIEKSARRVEWHCHRCYYVDEFNHYGVGELATIYCRVDDYIYGDMHNLDWQRTKTIGSGADLCNFKFKKEKRGKR